MKKPPDPSDDDGWRRSNDDAGGEVSSSRRVSCRVLASPCPAVSSQSKHTTLPFTAPLHLTCISLSLSLCLYYFKRPSKLSTATSSASFTSCVVVDPTPSTSSKRLDERWWRRSRIKVDEEGLLFCDDQGSLNGDTCVDGDIISMTTLSLVTPQGGMKHALVSQKRSSEADDRRGSKCLP